MRKIFLFCKLCVLFCDMFATLRNMISISRFFEKCEMSYVFRFGNVFLQNVILTWLAQQPTWWFLVSNLALQKPVWGPPCYNTFSPSLSLCLNQKYLGQPAAPKRGSGRSPREKSENQVLTKVYILGLGRYVALQDEKLHAGHPYIPTEGRTRGKVVSSGQYIVFIPETAETSRRHMRTHTII